MTDTAAYPFTPVRAEFPFLATSGYGPPPAYLDNAATTQKPQPVLDAVLDFYTTANSNIGRGFYDLSRRATAQYEEAREVVRRFVNAAHPDEIVFTRGTTDATNLLAETFARRLVGPGDNLVVSGMEHNSNLLPWRRLCERRGADLRIVSATAGTPVRPEDLAAVLSRRTRLVAVTHVANVLGTVNPVRDLVRVAHERGVPVVVDGAQAVAHLPVDVRGIGADFYCFSGHKVYGPMGVGVLYGRRDLLADLPPYQVGGGTVKGVSHDSPVAYVPVPARLEAGTPDIAAAVGLAAALSWLDGLDRRAVRAHDADLVRYAVTTLTGVDGVRVVGDPTADPAGIVSIVVPGLHPYDVGGHLDQHGVAVRSGVHCASTFLDELGLLGTVRLSFAVYNTTEEIDRVAAALRTLRAGEWTTRFPDVRFR
ncbi:cysteine desulfurase [Salinispora arenicola]|uniref:cysteine desulfurase n=1 Tax=Salinispora arenicola TaxID=168697 RepID=UPI000381F6D8|nr:cysteine desulfurase [Salinispora arenicola]NIL58917.1 cysteine desulfurase [Salinispora arenicola]NIL64387.1 cysteine desulfurase [Salinispora arenicola]